METQIRDNHSHKPLPLRLALALEVDSGPGHRVTASKRLAMVKPGCGIVSDAIRGKVKRAWNSSARPRLSKEKGRGSPKCS